MDGMPDKPTISRETPAAREKVFIDCSFAMGAEEVQQNGWADENGTLELLCLRR